MGTLQDALKQAGLASQEAIKTREQVEQGLDKAGRLVLRAIYGRCSSDAPTPEEMQIQEMQRPYKQRDDRDAAAHEFFRHTRDTHGDKVRPGSRSDRVRPQRKGGGIVRKY